MGESSGVKEEIKLNEKMIDLDYVGIYGEYVIKGSVLT
jgi:hypothetical protein